MSTDQKPGDANRILDAIRAKRDRRTGKVSDIAALEASLIADIESFDLNAAERQARREQLAGLHRSMDDIAMAFPEIMPDGTVRELDQPVKGPESRRGPQGGAKASNLLDLLRHQAELRQRELHSEMAERSASNLALEQVLKKLFFFLHDLVQQLNIVRPPIQREYTAAAGDLMFSGLTWQEGFADYRTQSQSKGAMIELVSLAYQLVSPTTLSIKRDGTGVERLRLALFDYGLQFTCKEFKNEYSYIERAEFEVSGQVSVSARWKADFQNGVLILETRNLERLGSEPFTIRPAAVDESLLDEFGRLLLGLPNKFKVLAKR